MNESFRKNAPLSVLALLSISLAFAASGPDAVAKPKQQGKIMCDCICASDAQDPSSHVPLWTGNVSFEAEYGSCGGDLGDCAVKDSGGHSVPGRLHSCSRTSVPAKLQGQFGPIQIGPIKKRP